MIHLIVDLKAVPKARPRFTRSGKVYTAKTTCDFESHIKKLASLMIDKPYENAVEVRIIFNFKQAKSNKLLMHTQRPDLDNLAKAVCDALNKVAYLDDSQIVKLYSEKNFSTSDSIEITIAEIK